MRKIRAERKNLFGTISRFVILREPKPRLAKPCAIGSGSGKAYFLRGANHRKNEERFVARPGRFFRPDR